MIDAGHIFLLVVVTILGLWGYMKSHKAKSLENENSSLKFDQNIKEMKNEILNTSNDELIRRANAKYGKGH